MQFIGEIKMSRWASKRLEVACDWTSRDKGKATMATESG